MATPCCCCVQDFYLLLVVCGYSVFLFSGLLHLPNYMYLLGEIYISISQACTCSSPERAAQFYLASMSSPGILLPRTCCVGVAPFATLLIARNDARIYNNEFDGGCPASASARHAKQPSQKSFSLLSSPLTSSDGFVLKTLLVSIQARSLQALPVCNKVHTALRSPLRMVQGEPTYTSMIVVQYLNHEEAAVTVQFVLCVGMGFTLVCFFGGRRWSCKSVSEHGNLLCTAFTSVFTLHTGVYATRQCFYLIVLDGMAICCAVVLNALSRSRPMASEVGPPSALLTPDDLYSQAQHFNVDLGREPYLLPVMKQAAIIPNPPKRQHDDDDHGGEHYFLDQIKLLRHRRQQQVENRKQENETFAWMAFEELTPPEKGNKTAKKSTTYYYDFVTKSRQDMHPLVPLLGDDNASTATDDADPIARAADPQEFEHAAMLHKQTSMKNITELEILCFHCWWKETSLLGETRQCRLRLYFSIPTRHFQMVMEDSPNVFTISHIAHAVTGVYLSVWDLHEGARLTVLGRPTTLRQASLLTRQWLEVHERRLLPVMEKLQKELAKYELRSHGRSPAAAAPGRILCADPHRSRSGVSLRQLLDEIVLLQTKLATYRPDLARRLCEPLADLDTA